MAAGQAFALPTSLAITATHTAILAGCGASRDRATGHGATWTRPHLEIGQSGSDGLVPPLPSLSN